MGGAFSFNGCNKLEKNSFNNILAIKISFVFEFNSTNSFSAHTNLDTFRFYQKILMKVARQLANLQLKEGLKEIENEKIWMAVEKMRKGKRRFQRKKKYIKCREEMNVSYRRP